MNILFVCTGNTCRSPMAETIAANMIAKDSRLAGKVFVGSAGVAAFSGSDMTMRSIQALRDLGFMPREHSSRMFTETLAQASDMIICMEQAHLEAIQRVYPGYAGKLHAFAEFAGHDIEDPYGGGSNVYNEAAREIVKGVSALLSAIKADIIT